VSLKQRILLVEDHTLVRVGLCALLSREPDLEVVGEAANGRDAIRLAVSLSPDLVIMDLTMPGINGIEAIEEIKRRQPDLRVLVVTLHRAEEYVQESFRAGANGYILKEATHEELRVAVRSVLSGKIYVSPDISNALIPNYRRGSGSPSFSSAWESVTLREREVLKLVAEGHSNKSIGQYLCLSAKTVEKHRSNLMRKLNLHKISSLTAFAIDKGLVNTDCAPPARTRV
jgi:DNA-binding NarL/FixJ family response regulator